MSYLLASTSIRSPNMMGENNSTQMTQIRTLSGAVNRDYFGSNKRIWNLAYRNLQKADYDIINAIYQAYLSTGTPVAWQVTEANYTVNPTTVHIDFQSRSFSAKGSGYLSDISLILTEA